MRSLWSTVCELFTLVRSLADVRSDPLSQAGAIATVVVVRKRGVMSNLSPLPHQLLKILGLSLEDARKIAEAVGYKVEVLVPEIRLNVWGEEEETGWVITDGSYAPDRIYVALDENGDVSLVSY